MGTIEWRGITQEFTLRGESGMSQIVAIKDVTLTVAKGEFVAIVGPSGCGKSTLLNIASGLTRPTKGSVLIDGEDVTGRTHPGVGYMFQEDTVLPWYNVHRNVGLGLRYRKVAEAEIDQRVRGLLKLGGLSDFAKAYPHQLSGGMRRRVALLMTLAVNPEIMLMDEPFGALDTHTKTQLHSALLHMWTQTKQTVIFVTHDLVEAITLSDRIIVMSAHPGTIKADYRVTLPRPRDVIRSKESDEYLADFRAVWRFLGEEFMAADRESEVV